MKNFMILSASGKCEICGEHTDIVLNKSTCWSCGHVKTTKWRVYKRQLQRMMKQAKKENQFIKNYIKTAPDWQKNISNIRYEKEITIRAIAKATGIGLRKNLRYRAVKM